MASLTLTTTATVPEGSTLYVTVEEDPDGDGVFENAATTTVPDGTAEQSLDGFDATKGNDIRVYRAYDYSTTDGVELQSVDVTPGAVVLVWDTEGDWNAAEKDGIQVNGSTFTLASAIPDSGVRHWPFPKRTTSTVVEELANDDGTVTGSPTNTADASFYDGYYESTDGTEDAVLLPVGEFESQIQSKEFGFALTVRTTDDEDLNHIYGSLDSAADNRFQFYESNGGNYWGASIRVGGNANTLQLADSDISDGTLRRVFFHVSTDDASNWAIYVNDSDVNASINANNVSDLSQIDLGGNRVAVGAREFGGTVDQFIQLDADNPILYDNPSRSDVTEDYNLQPWS